MTRLSPPRWTFWALLANGLLAAGIYGAYSGTPLRLYDHHLVLLLTQNPDLQQDNFFWRLIHHRLGGETQMYFRFLSYPLIYAQALLFGADAPLHYGVHLLAHLGAAFSLFRAAHALSRDALAALLGMALFTFFCGSSDLLGTPYYTHVFLAMIPFAEAIRRFLRHLETGRARDLAAATALSLVATAIYDTFLLFTLGLPFLASALRQRRATAVLSPGGRGWALAGGAVALLALATMTQSFVPDYMRSAGIGRSALDTMFITLLRAPFAAATSALKLVMDAFFFMTGHVPPAVTPGHMPYWDLAPLLHGTARSILSFGAAFAGWRLLVRSGTAPRAGGILLWAGALSLDAPATLMALFAALLGARAWAPPSSALLFLLAAGFLCAFNTAIGRSRFYSLAAIRHHYVTGFVLILAIAHLAGRSRIADGPRSGRRLVGGVLALLVLLNVHASSSVIARYKADIRDLLGVHRLLDETSSRSQRLFIPLSPSGLLPPRARPNPSEEWVFDILRGPANPLTRHVARADFLLENGKAAPNPLYGSPASGDFLIRFRLHTEECPLRFDAKGAYACFGRRGEDPRLEVTRTGFRLRVTRIVDDAEEVYDFPLPIETNRFFYETKPVTLARQGRSLALRAQDLLTAAYEVPPERDFVPWLSDNLDLLGKDAETLMAKRVVYDTYIRIGPGLPGRVP